MDSDTIHKAAAAVRKSMNGDHFTNAECLAAVQVLDLVATFGAAAHLPLISYWAGNKHDTFASYAKARGIL